MKQGETTFRQLLEANWKIPNEKILKHFELTADENGYPYIANWPDFIKEKDELEVFKTLMYYLLKKKLPLPLVHQVQFYLQQNPKIVHEDFPRSLRFD